MTTTHTKSARGKTHRCYLCAQPIVAGERYYRDTWFDGDMSTTYTHTGCDELATLLLRTKAGEFYLKDPGDGTFFEYALRDNAAEMVGCLRADGDADLADRLEKLMKGWEP